MKRLFNQPFDFGSCDLGGIPKKVLEIFESGFSFALPKLNTAKESRYDGSVKFLFELRDGQMIESVLMPETNRLTVCLSSQVGCGQGCVFCSTGRMGLSRNLEAFEIIGQIVQLNFWLKRNPGWLRNQNLPISKVITNVVFMGMGEPCDNVKHVSNAISIMSDPWAIEIAPSKITISTAGHLDGLKQLYEKQPSINYALSLHSTTNRERSRLMPINRKYPIEAVIEFLASMSRAYKKTFLIQYTVINKVNDHVRSALELAFLLRDVKCKINLIPLNHICISLLKAPERKRLLRFRDTLNAMGLRVMIRYSKGQDIEAACGQLALNH